ncbi:DUF1492 domain-containing protein [Paenibacillus nasutitermitis]|uniref:Uncharacterized protein n=1 Tax=Paenibacillus nasutitermitis TaxID=1652958 RepID=A0A916ZGN9_9BACL|nr:DUF1492 domain-containing protein [Paenibacillus nasutitermitis]GGD95114.1 hypothetical protein GCM10010911_62250 [Paenibacillus nasutitermitis]
MNEKHNEQNAIDQLRSYKRLTARIKVLEKQPVGNGIYISSFRQDDQLQELHRQLRGLPSYMYLNKREQKLETTAHAYLNQYKTGTHSQLREVSGLSPADEEDQKLLRELKGKIEKVIEARSGVRSGYDDVIERISELQKIEQEKKQIEWAIEVLGEYKPEYAQLLRLEFMEDKNAAAMMDELGVSRSTLYNWRRKSIEEYGAITGARGQGMLAH